ncbi:MAG: LPP20 family lipoprotein [Campylobacterota bacterium]|nr:LPP20 family lipoprotein [Campylobacterota bacterium]
MKLLSLFILIVATLHAQIPEWFKNRIYQPQNGYEIIGYGVAPTIKEAALLAKEDIASQMQTELDAHTSVQLSDSNGTATRQVDIRVDALVHTVLNDTRQLQMDYLDGKYYIAYLYENMKLAQRFVKKIKDIECSKTGLNPYLKNTPMFDQIKEIVGCNVDFNLARKDGAWYIAYKTTLIPIAPIDYGDLFISTRQGPIWLQTSKRVLIEGDRFWFNIKASESGFVTLLGVYANGMTSIVIPSFKVEKNRKYQIPSEDDEAYLEAGLLKEGEATYDLYVALFSEKPLHLSRFEETSTHLMTEESAYKANEVLKLCERYPFSTLLVRTKPAKK